MNKKTFTMTLSEEICDSLDELARKRGLTRMALLRMIVIKYLNNNEEE